MPQGGVTAFVRFPFMESVDEFCHQLTKLRKVLLVPGSCFNRPQHARLGFGGPTAAVRQGLAHVSELLQRATPESAAPAHRSASLS
jgi:aspartate/methionine/tyrosine aminotransferase